MKKGCFVLAAVLLTVALLGIFAGPPLLRQGARLLYPKPYGEIVARETAEFGLEEELVYAVMKAESGFDQDARSHAGAMGLMQLTEQTFQWIASLYPPENGGKDPMDPSDNIHCGCALLRLLQDHYGSQRVALCAYNAGMGTVDGWLAREDCSKDGSGLHAIPYPETEAYVEEVLKNYRRYQKLYPAE